jgi:steroid delta-isomerase-like uncharacterized protein
MSMRKAFSLFAIPALAILIAAPAGADSPSLESSKAVARKLFEVVLNRDKWDLYQEIHSRGFVAHAGKKTAGLSEDLQSAKEWRKAFPDGTYTVDRVVAEDDMVVVQYTGRGTNTGSGNGIPITGKRVEVTGVTIFRISDGKIAEEWNESDMLGLMRQLGLLPPMQ